EGGHRSCTGVKQHPCGSKTQQLHHQHHHQQQQQVASSFVMGPISRFTALYFDEEIDPEDADSSSGGDDEHASCSGLSGGGRRGIADAAGNVSETVSPPVCGGGPADGRGRGLSSASGTGTPKSDRLGRCELSPPRYHHKRARLRRRIDYKADLLEVVKATRQAVGEQREADQEALAGIEPACFMNAKVTPKTPKKEKKPPLVIELLPTCWRIRTISTERLRHGDGHKKTANLQYCFASRQIMLDLDNGRFPLALMWALPEVMQEAGTVIAEIHDLRGNALDAGNPSVGTTLLQPFGEGICPKGTHHPPGLGQGPGQGERFASDGSYIASGANTAAGTSRGRSRSGSNSCAADGAADAADVVDARNSPEGSVHQPQQLGRSDSPNRGQDRSSD
ncbi:unnamed protein product, partial [Ectocarpus sp. 8 AP-2014]